MGCFFKFKWEFSEFLSLSEVNHTLEEEDRIPMRRPMYAAINVASTAWSLVEWVWREAYANEEVLKRLTEMVGEANTHTSRELKDWMRNNEDLEACYQIAHQAKHGNMRRPNEQFQTRVVMWYPANPDGIRGWRQVGYVMWKFDTCDKESSIRNLFDRVLRYWDSTLHQLNIPERMIAIA